MTVMKSAPFKTFVLLATTVVLLACGKTPNGPERTYAEACVKINDSQKSKGEATRKLCECAANIVVPKLTPGELNAYVNSLDMMGKPLTPESAAAHGFTIAEFSSLGVKRQALFAEMRKTCGAESF